MAEATFFYHGLKIDIRSDNEWFLELLTSYHDFLLRPTPEPGLSEISISIDTGKKIEQEYFGTVVLDQNAVMTRASGRKFAEVIIDPHTNSVTALLPEPESYVIEAQFEAVFMQPLKYLAKKSGIFFLHASSVAFDDTRGIIFLGNQHKGKSTLALTLLLNGYSYVAEESPSVCIHNGQPLIYGFPEPIGVGVNSLKNFPELKKYCRDTTGPYLKHRLKYDTFCTGNALDICRPSTLFFPEYRESGPLEIREVPKLEALQRIINLELEAFTDEYNRPLAQNHMEALGALAQNTEVFELFYNDHHLSDLPSFITDIVTRKKP
jgi:hypothetical protein